MKYHVVLSVPSRGLDSDFTDDIKNAVKSLNSEMNKTLVKLLKKEKEEHCSELFYFYFEKSMHSLQNQLNDNDEIVIHGHGYPFFIGPSDSGSEFYTATPKKFADQLVRFIPDLNIRVQLLTCNSATSYNKRNFAQDVSTALYVYHQYKNISIMGFTGYIEVKTNAKYAVCSKLDGKMGKGEHSDLQSASKVYLKGSLLDESGNKTLIKSLSGTATSWANFFINEMLKEREEMELLDNRKLNEDSSISTSKNRLFIEINRINSVNKNCQRPISPQDTSFFVKV